MANDEKVRDALTNTLQVLCLEEKPTSPKLDMLYHKDAMAQFVKTIGYTQPSYVIRKVTAVFCPMMYCRTEAVYVHFIVPKQPLPKLSKF